MSPSGPIIQVNLNHSARAQDLLMQTLVEWEAGLAVAAEPYRVPNHPNWVGDQLGSATVVRPGSPPLSIIECGRGFLAVSWGDLAVVAIYVPPSWPHAVFERYLDGVGRCISRCLPVLVLGDFNSKSQAWGSPETDARGREVLEWAAGLELCLLNTGSVDIYVVLGLSAGRNAQPRRRPVAARPPPRWPLKEMDEDALMAAAHVVAWPDGRACRRAGGSPTAPERNEGDMRRRYAPGQGPPEEGGVLLVARDCGYSH
ncbi:uncharacterized protein LOC128882088 [Hylaeus volcanicus]|uniref:uncharacterized protein LOC128882088 n=1 Tax=Hylaeus volcanicus TaxID=313075 RepID=UPI0023B7A1CD|nr:uncharacterized protein LOC128882088 [Hylaeus volcanicus]